MTHDLKTWPEFFIQIKKGQKRFELRKDDRNFSVGDWVYLREFNPKTNNYTGEAIYVKITYILRVAEYFGLKDGYCIFGFRKIT